jgi:Cryptococcal mannosyltransferase 1
MASLPLPSVTLRNHHSSLVLRLRSLLRRWRYAIGTIGVLTVFAMAFYSPVANISIPSNVSSGLGKAALSVQNEAYSLANGQRPTCRQTSWHQKRYASLHSTTASRTTNIFLGINFHNNEDVLPTFFQELPQVLRHVGPHQVFVSVYENGSDDKTPDLLKLCASLVIPFFYGLHGSLI